MYLDEWNLKRNHIAEYYRNRLSINPGIFLPQISVNTKHVFHLFVIRSLRRLDIIKFLEEENISWAVHYPKPLPFLDAYRYKNHIEAEFPVSCRITNEILSLPMYPELNDTQMSLICDQVLKIS
jgi:dTDP-4-amino-4,6-dideoxygalactose transaminase